MQGESSSFIEECYLPVTVMIYPAEVKKKKSPAASADFWPAASTKPTYLLRLHSQLLM